MRRRNLAQLACSVCAGLAALMLGASGVQAQYLDPGAGSMIVQVVIAVTVGAAAAVKLYWGRISAFLTQWRRRRANRA